MYFPVQWTPRTFLTAPISKVHPCKTICPCTTWRKGSEQKLREEHTSSVVESLPDSRRLSSVLPRYPGILDKQEIGEIGCSCILHCTYEISHIQCPILEHTQSQVHNETCYCWQMLRESRPPWLCVQLLSNSGIWSSGQGHEHRKQTGSSSPKRWTRTESAVKWTTVIQMWLKNLHSFWQGSGCPEAWR